MTAGTTVEVPNNDIKNESTPELCSNGLDDDGDGKADCEDFHCLLNPEVGCAEAGENSDELCSDEIDNDENNFADCMDFNCSRNLWVTVCGP
jgi:hypothetical protein